MPDRALEGTTVIECGRTAAAAYGGKLLADLGAAVIKVESPDGDPARALGPFPGGEPNPEAGALYLYLNTNKQGITLDLTRPQGRDVLGRLVATADVLIHDFDPEQASAAGLTYERVHQESANIVMTSIFPFGSDGPERDYIAHDLTLLSAGGWTWINGWPGHPEMPPLKPYGFQAAYQGGLNAAMATLGALFARMRGAGGQHIEISIQACIASILESVLPTWTYMETPVMRWGNRPIHPIDMFQCKDGNWVFALCIEEHQWQRLVEVMGAPEWTQWEVSANRFVRASNWDALRPFMEEWVAQWNADDLYRAVQEKRVPFAPVSTIGTLLESEHLKVRGFFVQVVHRHQSLSHPGAPFRMSQTPWEIRMPAPGLGQHTNEVLAGRLGLAEAEIGVLREQGAI